MEIDKQIESYHLLIPPQMLKWVGIRGSSLEHNNQTSAMGCSDLAIFASQRLHCWDVGVGTLIWVLLYGAQAF